MTNIARSLDPARLRAALELMRGQGLGFEDAWHNALLSTRRDDEETRDLIEFMEPHFRAAYYRYGVPRGVIPDRDTSSAIRREPRQFDPCRDHDLCQSGDECDRRAVRGRFGRFWCDHHAGELERLAVQFGYDGQALRIPHVRRAA